MELTKAITVFLEDQGSDNTARSYGCSLRRFMEWFPVKTVNDLDPKQVIPFARALKREGLSPSSISAYLSGIVQFLQWLKRERVADVSAEDLMELKERVKGWNKKNKSKKLPRLPRETAVEATLQAAHGAQGYNERSQMVILRNIALIETWLATGCRISETAKMKRADLDDNMTAWVRGGKGDKDRLIIFRDEDAWLAVQTYLQERDNLGFEIVGEEPLFARHDKASHSWGKIMPMSPNSMRVALNGIQERAGAQHFSPHQLRHQAATDLYNRTGDIKVVQEYLGHADVSTTAGTYTHLSKDRLIETVRGG